MSHETDILLTCPACGAKNRTAVARLADRPTCGSCKEPLLSPDHPVELDDTTFPAVVRNSPVPVLVDFWATWCGPCRSFAPQLHEFARNAAGRVLVAKVDVDRARQTASVHRVQSVPTLAVFVNGHEAARHVGGMTAAQLQAFVSAA